MHGVRLKTGDRVENTVNTSQEGTVRKVRNLFFELQELLQQQEHDVVVLALIKTLWFNLKLDLENFEESVDHFSMLKKIEDYVRATI